MRGKRGRRTAIIATTMLAGACKDPPQAPPPPPAPPAHVAKSDDAAALWRDPVTSDRFARRVLYTWTTADQIAELRTSKRLLVREESPANGASYFEQYMHGLAARDPIAKLLDTTTFAKSRFAWPAPWATSAGMGAEQWGDQLIRVTLKTDAIVLAVSSRTGTFTARDLDNRTVALDLVMQHPERIGAVYFEAAKYREMVLCNESMIAGWSVGTQDIVDEVEAEARALAALATELRAGPVTSELQRTFASAVAIQTIALEPAALDEVVKRLRALPRPAALEGVSTVAFPGPGSARKLRVVPKPQGTDSTFSNGTY